MPHQWMVVFCLPERGQCLFEHVACSCCFMVEFAGIISVRTAMAIARACNRSPLRVSPNKLISWLSARSTHSSN